MGEFTGVPAETITTEEGVTFTPESVDGGIGYKITSPGGAVEYVFLVPSTEHQYNDDNGAIADTFIYHVDMAGAEAWAEENAGPGTGMDLVADLAEPLIYLNHFSKED